MREAKMFSDKSLIRDFEEDRKLILADNDRLREKCRALMREKAELLEVLKELWNDGDADVLFWGELYIDGQFAAKVRQIIAKAEGKDD